MHEVPEIDRRDLQPLQRTVGTDEVGDEIVGRVPEHLCRRVVLREVPALSENGDAVAELDGLFDVVGHEHDGLLDFRLETQELVLQPFTVDGVDGAEGLVHQQHSRIGAERARHPHSLALPT